MQLRRGARHLICTQVDAMQSVRRGVEDRDPGERDRERPARPAALVEVGFYFRIDRHLPAVVCGQ